MGMFDWIKYKMKCPKCGTEVKGFQSKDGSCVLDNLNFWKVNKFYSSCDGCGLWIEFNRKRPTPKVGIEDYEMSVSKLRGEIH